MSRCICCKRKDECGCYPEPGMCDAGHPAGCRDEDGYGTCRWCADMSALRAVRARARYLGVRLARERLKAWLRSLACVPELPSGDCLLAVESRIDALEAAEAKYLERWREARRPRASSP